MSKPLKRQTGTKMKTLEQPNGRKTKAEAEAYVSAFKELWDDPEPLAQCPDCSGNGTVTIGQYNDGEFREGFCQTCEGRGSIPLTQYLLDIHEEEILAEEVGA